MTHDEKHPETAAEEVLREIEKAERRTRDTEEQRRHRGEAGEAITPNARAQEESEGE
ncbi:hypothetical protein [Streptomyces sp. Act143]|uniref:hypothetical protein n=1 Tax=Streptomyces sp. Act143 TaxID=2200760 RepID=UPI0015E7E6BB|nr:hypothetical protein [Streptomyces sp. Act143]